MSDTIEQRKMWTDSILTVKPLASSAIMTNNLSVSFAIFGSGITAGLGTCYLLTLNGVLFGVILAACWQAGMLAKILGFVVGHGVLELPAIFIAGGAGLLIARGLLFPGLLPRRDSLANVPAYREIMNRCRASAGVGEVVPDFRWFVEPFGYAEALRTEMLHSGVNVMWVCPGFTASNIRMAALDNHGKARGESVLNEGGLMSAEECARHILRAIERRKRTLVLTFLGKVTILLNKVVPSLADRLTYKHYYNKQGEFVK